MDDAHCPRCEERVRRHDAFCRHCGRHLGSAPADEATLVTDVSLAPPAVALSLRSELTPLLRSPALRRTATVLAAALVADWALRTLTGVLVREGLSLLVGGDGRSPRALRTFLPRSGSGPPEEQETVVEQRITVRRS